MADSKMTATKESSYEADIASHNRACAANIRTALDAIKSEIGDFKTSNSADVDAVTKMSSALNMFDRQLSPGLGYFVGAPAQPTP